MCRTEHPALEANHPVPQKASSEQIKGICGTSRSRALLSKSKGRKMILVP